MLRIQNSVADSLSKPSQNILHHFKAVLIMLLVCGYDYEFYSIPRVVKGMISVYCLLLVTSICYATAICCLDDDISQVWSLLEYSLTVCMLLITKSKIKHFFAKLKYVDCNLRINMKHHRQDHRKILVHIGLIWIIRIFYTFMNCYYYPCSDSYFLYVVSQFPPLALDLLRIWRFTLFDLIRFRLKTLRLRLEEDLDNNFYLHVENKKTLKEKKFNYCMLIYKNLAETFDVITPALFSSLLISVVCVVPKLIFYVYQILLVIVKSKSSTSMTVATMHLVQICFYIFSPCVVAELYSTEVEKIRLILMHKLIEGPDMNLKEELKRFLQFTEIRPFQYKIWRVIPINMTLPLEIVNLCTTYVIVLVNFTHLY